MSRRLNFIAARIPPRIFWLGMGTLSNFPWFRAFRHAEQGSAAPIVYRPAETGEFDPAVRLMLAGSAGAEEPQVRDFVRLARSRAADAGGLYVAERGGRLISAVLPVVSPGRTMLLFVPARPRHAGQAEATAALIEGACQRGAHEGVHLAQTLPDPDDPAAIGVVESCGFARLAELLYLNTVAPRSAKPPTPPAGWTWRTYSPSVHGLFADTILATYHQSLDCPALNGRRGIEDVLAGHQATGEFDPAHWLLLGDDEGRPAAALLLSHIARTDAMELVYLGIVPRHRGRGVSDLLMRQAVWMVAATRNTRLSLAVDAGNSPALRLYFRHGMQAAGRKLAMMRDLRGEQDEQTSAQRDKENA